MRNAFAATLIELAEVDKSIILLSGDIGNRLFDGFKRKFPDRFFNCGVAEANMTSMAAGMAMCGLRPITYTITPFNTTRCLEQIRVDVCYQNLPVVVVGVGAGLSYAELGGTHQSCEDIAFLRALPNMSVVCPCDAIEVKLALQAATKHDGPVYLRLGKKNEPLIHKHDLNFEIGKSIVISEGTDVCLISTGNIMPVVIEAQKRLENSGFSVQVVSMHTVKPLDIELLNHVFSSCKVVCTVEEHSLIGGLGAAVTEWYIEKLPQKSKLLRVGLDDVFMHRCGNQANARCAAGLTPEAIANKILTSQTL